MHIVLCTNTHRDVTDSVKIPKFEYLENGTQFFYEIKIFLICAFRWHIVGGYHFVTDVAFNYLFNKIHLKLLDSYSKTT